MIATRYIVAALLRSYLIVALALLALFGLFNFMEQADDIGNGSYTAAGALYVVLLSLPATLLDLAPFVAMLGTIYGLAGFVRTQELIALRAAGVSQLRLSLVTLLGASLLVLALVALEWVARPLLQNGSLARASATSVDGNMLSREGSWITSGNRFAFVGSYRNGQVPVDIAVYEFDGDRQLVQYLRAESARIASSSLWQLEEVVIKHLQGEPAPRIDTSRQRTLDWQPFWSQSTQLFDLPLQSLTLADLRRHSDFLRREGIESVSFELEFWRRCLLPLSALVFSLFVAQFLLAVRPRSGMGLAMASGGAAAIGIYLFQQILVSAVILTGASVWQAVLAPIVLVAGLALWLARRVNGAPI